MTPQNLHDPDSARILAAIEANHQSWFRATAVAASAPSHLDEDLALIAAAAPHGESHLPFPRLDPARPGEQLDAALAFVHGHRPAGSILAWAPDLPPDPVLATYLMARGFRCSFRPHWMSLDLDLLVDDHPAPADLRIAPLDDLTLWDSIPHPYWGAADSVDSRATVRADAQTMLIEPRHTWHLVAWLDGLPVGVATVHLTPDPDGIAGIYNVGVLEAHRNRGIGRAVTAAACRVARDLGATRAGLNATGMGEPVYRALGFQSLGWGQTWFLSTEALARTPLTPELVAFAEAIGLGDSATLATLTPQPDAETITTPLPCGLTPIQLAARCRQPATATWLLDRGAPLDPLSAWDLGWSDRIPAIVTTHPDLLHVPCGDSGGTPLHEAVYRDDPGLLAALLAAGADPTVRDAVHDATPQDWATHLKRPAISEVLRQHTPTSPT